MKALFYIMAIVLAGFGIYSAFQGDIEAFRFKIILGMLCYIYAEVTD